MSLLIHSLNIRFVVLVSIFKSLVSVFNNFFLITALQIFQSRDRAQLIKNLMLLFEPQSCEIILKIFQVDLSFSSSIHNSQQTSHFFLSDFSSKLSDITDNILPSDKISVVTYRAEDMLSIKVERA
jgi:hypothetical protein